MANSSGSGTKESSPKWKTKWPRNGDLRAWFVCMIEKCAAIENPVKAATEAHLPIHALANLGRVDEALKHIDRFLRKQPDHDSLEIVRLSSLAAEICLDADDLARMEKYLLRAAAAPVHRKCDLGWPEKVVREFRAQHGLLDPADAVDEEQRIEAIFKGGYRRFCDAIKKHQRPRIAAALADMRRAVALVDKDSFRCPRYHRTLVKALFEAGDVADAKQFIKRLDPTDAKDLVDYRTLQSCGLKAEAKAQAIAEIRSRLDQLLTMNDPNIHFPVQGICSALEFLADNGNAKDAKTWLKLVLKDIDTWPVIELGWTTSGVYTMLAAVVAKLDGPAAAEELLALAQQDATAERRSSWRKGAVAAAMTLEADLGKLDEAIAKARKLRSKTERRLQLAKLLARANRWKELAEICAEAATPEEAAGLCWCIKFELPGGEVK